ncbi:hypothetical protein L596_030213 [Steinernema carpocapsae]|uniref:SKP1 component POZ domain-containing protein n=1 Tax=Steinernema carpocapsae TaxID=34508 RepID=A0A4U5LS30_STECR|nr:hypothetical protein L596_030213 [Steinernema carpocapsae]
MAPSQTIKLTSSDGQTFEFKPEYLKKANMLKQMLSDLGFAEGGTCPEEGILLSSVEGEALGTILKWLANHEAEEPTTEEDRRINRFKKTVSDEDVALFDGCVPRSKLAAVINAAYYLEMPDLTTTLVRYTTNNLEEKRAASLSEWLEVPLKSTYIKKEAEDGGEGSSAQKRERH